MHVVVYPCFRTLGLATSHPPLRRVFHRQPAQNASGPPTFASVTMRRRVRAGRDTLTRWTIDKRESMRSRVDVGGRSEMARKRRDPVRKNEKRGPASCAVLGCIRADIRAHTCPNAFCQHWEASKQAGCKQDETEDVCIGWQTGSQHNGRRKRRRQRQRGGQAVERMSFSK